MGSHAPLDATLDGQPPACTPAHRSWRTGPGRAALSLLPALLALAALLPLPARAQPAPAEAATAPQPPAPVTASQRATARQVAQAGVPLSDLAPDAPARYTVRPGDTLWAIAGLYLRTPWRWPELWGMNLADIRNPHRIYPGQQLELVREGDRARLRTAAAAGSASASTDPITTVQVVPRVRSEPLTGLGLPTLKPELIEPFLAEPMVVAEGALANAAQILAARDQRVLLTVGDRAYARGPAGSPLTEPATGARGDADWVVVRPGRALRDPLTGQSLGQEVQTLGRARVVRGESPQAQPPVPASLDILAAKMEIRPGDRLLPLPQRQFVNYAPRAPEAPVPGAAIAALQGEAVGVAGVHQVVAINRGTADGLASGHVLAVLTKGTQAGRGTQAVQLPEEADGLVMVFRTFERVAYALVLESRQGVRVGDRLVSPR